MAKLTNEALRQVKFDLTMEDVKPVAIMRATEDELIEAWESYNGEMPAEWLVEN
jgi:hypothetical protein